MTQAPRNTHEKFPVFMEDQRRFFDELITAEWRSYQDADWERVRRFEIEQHFARVTPRRVLDVGCGCGYHDVLMAERAGVEAVTGIDYSEKSVEVANREYPHPRVTRFVGDIHELPAADYDLVVSFQVIEHLTDPVAFLTACARQVRAGGWVAVATPNRRRLMNRLLALAGRSPVLADPQHFREYTSEETRSLFVSAGLEWVTVFSYGLSAYVPRFFRDLIPSRLPPRCGGWLPGIADVFCAVGRKPA